MADFSNAGRNLEIVKAALDVRAAELARELLGEPNLKQSRRGELRFGTHGSLCVVIAGPKAGLFHDHENGSGGDLLDLIMRELNCGFREALEFARSFCRLGDGPPRPNPPRPTPRPARQPGDEEQRRKALYLWSKRKAIEGSPAEKYLREARGYTGPLASTLAYLPARDQHQHALIVPFGMPDEPELGVLHIPDAAVRGVHLIKLNADGSDRIRDGNGKITVGACLGSPLMVAPFAEGSPALAIAEGLENALIAHAARGCGAWAAGGAARLPALAGAVPKFVNAVTLVVDADDAGQRHAASLARRLQARRFKVLMTGRPAP